MRKIQITIFVLLLMIGGIGLAFAIFSFNDPISKNLDLGIELAEYTDLGELWIEDLLRIRQSYAGCNRTAR